jgi:transcriptional regulator with XRE-family HTH domain
MKVRICHIPAMDMRILGQELVRALRGRRSQTALSRRLGYRSNVLYMWESGRREPSGSELFRLLARTGRDPAAAWSRFAVELDGVDLTTPAGVATLLDQLRGDARVVEVARRAGVSRYTASRWLRGLSEPRLPELLALVEVLTLRVVDLVAEMVPPASVPTIAAAWSELETRRHVAFTHPWSQALARQLETEDYARLARHAPGWLAERLGLEPEEEARALAALEEAGLVTWNGERYVTAAVAVDTSMATDAQRRQLKMHWTDEARRRIEAGRDGQFSWAVVALSRQDYETLRAMHVRYVQSLRQLVDASSPSQIVAVANVQLFPLGS